eukprot:m.419264 g.419264  ORF g.419264 m.419264 type:complete len:264 (+) comp31408_c0_seq1:23-814(+)
MAAGRMARWDLVKKLLKGIETGDPAAAAVVNEAVYIQHNPRTKTGAVGLAELFTRLAKTEPTVTIVRAFEDGDIVFAHTDYRFGYAEVGFEVFRFDGDHAVEHWDNLQRAQPANPSGRTMLDGPTELTDLDKTEANRETIRMFVDEVLIGRQHDKLEQYMEAEFTEHNPRLADGIPALRTALGATRGDAPTSPRVVPLVQYDRVHKVLAEGNFVLSMCEGASNGVHSSFFDMYRLADGKIAEHWDTIDAVAPKSEWKNDNGKF